MIPPKWLELAGDLLDRASEEFANHGCNDWVYPPEHWTLDERREFAKAVHEATDSADNYDPNYLVFPDWWVMDFLARKIKEEASKDVGPEPTQG